MRLEPKAGLFATSATLEDDFEVEVDREAIAAYEGGDGRRHGFAMCNWESRARCARGRAFGLNQDDDLLSTATVNQR